MAQTKKDQALTFANEVLALAQQLQGLRATCKNINDRYTSEGYGTLWAAFATAAAAADGSLGTADGTPTAGHPIDTRVAGQAALNKAVTAAMLTSGITLVQQLTNLFGNQAVVTGNYSQTIDDLSPV